MVIELTMHNIDQILQERNYINIMMFYGEGCGPCTSTMPHYTQVATEIHAKFPSIRFYKINAWTPEEQKTYCNKAWQIRGVPTFVMVFNGVQINRVDGGGDYERLMTMVNDTIEIAYNRKQIPKNVQTNSPNIPSNSPNVPTLKILPLVPHAKIPEKAYSGDMGYDLFSSEDITIPPLKSSLVPTGIAVGFPDMIGAILKDRSSVASKRGLFIHAGVIDSGYTGEIKILMFNSTPDPVRIVSGEKIAQMILTPVITFPVERVTSLESADGRFSNGFGSTGN